MSYFSTIMINSVEEVCQKIVRKKSKVISFFFKIFGLFSSQILFSVDFNGLFTAQL